jgi:hypothetical protein
VRSPGSRATRSLSRHSPGGAPLTDSAVAAMMVLLRATGAA